MNEALGSLVLAASLAGAPAVAPVNAPRSAPARTAAGETTVARATLASVAAAQASGSVTRAFGGAPLEAAISFDGDGASWLTLRQGAWRASYSESAMAAGATADLPTGTVSLKEDKGVITLSAPAGATLSLTEKELIDPLYAAAVKFTLGPATYAGLWTDGKTTPAALDLLRRDGNGDYFVTYRTPAQMKSGTQWVMGADMVLYGMRIEGLELVFVSKPVSAVGAAARRH
jgi:hypothetical protein